MCLFGSVFAASSKQESSNAKTGKKAFEGIYLIQDSNVLKLRIENLEGFSAYIQEVQNQIYNSDISAKKLGDGYIYLAIHQGKRAKAWYVFDNTDVEVLKSLDKVVLSVQPCDIKGGVVIVVLSNLTASEGQQIPMPGAWEEVITSSKKGEINDFDDLLNKIWPSAVSKQDKAELLKLISAFKKDANYSKENLEKYSKIIEFAVKSDLVSISITESYLPPDYKDSEYGSMFFLAYIAGNLEQQLKLGKCQDCPAEGIAFEIAKYKQLKKANKELNIPFFEEDKK